MDIVYNNNVSLTKEKFDVIKEQSTLIYKDNDTDICTKERYEKFKRVSNTTIKQPCKIAEKEKIKADKIAEKEKIKADKIAEKEKIKADKIAEKEKIKADKIAEKEKIKADKIAEKEKIKADKKSEKEKIKADKKSQKRKRLKADKKSEKGRTKTNKIVGIKTNKKNENVINLDNQHKQYDNDVKVKGRPRIEYNVKIVTEINDDEQQDYNFLEVEEYCTEVTIDGVIYYQDRNLVLYDYETHEEI